MYRSSQERSRCSPTERAGGTLATARFRGGPLNVFDRRPPHPLTPINITVTVTEALRAVAEDQMTVTVLTFPVVGSNRDEPLRFSRLTLLSYD